MTNKTNDKIEQLEESPIFAMSLSSNELFHSNFWAWLIEKDHDFAKAFFPDFDPKSFKSVKREEKNRDITIHINDSKECYVIENKIKSIPTAEQLKKYQDDLKGNFIGGVLTGLKETLDLSALPGWTFVSYTDIAKKIEKIAQKSDAAEIEKNLDFINEYCTVAKAISGLLTENLDSVKGKLSYECKDKGALETLRLYDIFQKMKAEDFAKSLKDEISKEIKNGEIEITTGFTRSTSLIDIKFLESSDKKAKEGIGIQIQGYQYRRIIEMAKTNPGSENIFEQFKGLGWFEDYEIPSKEIFKQHTGMSKKYLKYGETFVYQYYNLDKGTSYTDLIQAIITDMQEAIKIWKKAK